jgi:ribonucleoside-diphosphate reductase beta chain
MSTTANGRVFATTSPRGLRYDLPPMRLWQKAKQLGVWDPRAIDFTRDVRDWEGLDERQREALMRQSALFLAGEESVTLDLLPLILLIAREGRIEEEMYLTSFLWEEAKHVDGFRRFFDEVARDHSDLSRFHGPNYRRIFYDELPAAMNRLLVDPSPVAQVRASVTYNMIVEGVLAETGYYGYGRSLTDNGLLPGMQQFIGLLKRDESRHIAFAVYFLSRLMAEHGDAVWEAFEQRMRELLPLALGVVDDSYVDYVDGEPQPFDVPRDEVVAYATQQFQKRLARIERARRLTLAEVYQEANSLEDVEA